MRLPRRYASSDGNVGNLKSFVGYPATATLGYSGLAVFFGGMVGCIVCRDPWLNVGALSDTGSLARVGRNSYCIYLIHIPVGGVVEIMVREAARLIDPHFNPYGIAQVIAASLAMAVSICCAYLSWTLLESLCLKLRERLAPGRSAAVG